MPALPFALVAFALGTVLLQWQPSLPAAIAWIGAATAFALTGALIRDRVVSAHGLAALLAVAAAGTLGFGYGAWRADARRAEPVARERCVVGAPDWRAQARLADALPLQCEGVDIVVVGVIDDLPSVTEQGARFAFAVEHVETEGASVPERLSLAWYAQRRKDRGGDDVPDLVAGERWRLIVRLKRPHGTVNPYSFDVEAWLLENGFRATGYVRNDDGNVRLANFAGRASDYVQR